MLTRIALVASVLPAGVFAQTTYTGCHMHGSVSYCFGPNGQESPMTTLTAAISTLRTSTTSAVSVISTTSATPASVAASTTSAVQITAVTGCHTHSTNIFCINGSGKEVQVSVSGTPATPLPAQYTDCHSHGTNSFCIDSKGNDVQIIGIDDVATATATAMATSTASGEMDCHFHAGVEHCVPVGGSESSTESATVCDAPAIREYNIRLRVGSIFIILVTSGIGVFFPLVLHKLPFVKINGTLFTMIKQFGTGIIISTAFVHLYTHASLMFTNQCLAGINYEATTSAVVMAGLFVAFLVEYTGYRFVLSREKTQSHNAQIVSANHNTITIEADSKSTNAPPPSALQNISHSHSPADFDPNTILAVTIMEAGILFHSILIGLTLTVAPDNSSSSPGYYTTLLAVIVFHQFFEGLALGARIALLPTSTLRFGTRSKILMASAFTLITPLGMAIGIGVLNRFNGNSRRTILTIAVLDALSAGVLLWVGVVDMWARDWAVVGGEMVEAGGWKVGVGLLSFVVGLVLMSVLGKWA